MPSTNTRYEPLKENTGKMEKDAAYEFLTQIIGEITGSKPTQEELARNFTLMDEDKSGDIDKEEAIKFLKGFKLGH